MSKTFQFNYNRTALEIRNYIQAPSRVLTLVAESETVRNELVNVVGSDRLGESQVAANYHGLFICHRYDGGESLTTVAAQRLIVAGWKESKAS